MAKAYMDTRGYKIVGDQVINQPATAHGLAIACGTTWETLRDYRSGKYDTEDEKFSLTVKWWVEHIKEFAEQGLYTARSAAGPIFHLANLSKADGEGAWKNVEGREITGKDGGALEIKLTKADEGL